MLVTRSYGKPWVKDFQIDRLHCVIVTFVWDHGNFMAYIHPCTDHCITYFHGFLLFAVDDVILTAS